MGLSYSLVSGESRRPSEPNCFRRFDRIVAFPALRNVYKKKEEKAIELSQYIIRRLEVQSFDVKMFDDEHAMKQRNIREINKKHERD